MHWDKEVKRSPTRSSITSITRTRKTVNRSSKPRITGCAIQSTGTQTATATGTRPAP